MTHKVHFLSGLATLGLSLLAAGVSSAATLQVGPGQQYAKPCSAIAAAAPGDTIIIDGAGSYSGDVCQWFQNGLTLRGVNGRPHIDAAGRNSAGKGIWVIDGDNTVVENIELSGATVVDGNGAGIRLEAPNLVIRNCFIHNNQDGLLTGNGGTGSILIEYSEFSFNGTGTGQTHNIYVGQQGLFTMRFSYSHDAIGGQLVKTRAAENHIRYNRLTTENGTTSYEIDIPNGGLSYVIGNLVQQGIHGVNDNIMDYMIEGASAHNPDHRLFVSNNTFVNDKPLGTFILLPVIDTTPAVVQNNIFRGPGSVITQASAILSHNLVNVDPLFINAAGLDYHLQSGSPAINAGIDPGSGAGQSLNADYQYLHPRCGQNRAPVGAIDIGAYEFGNTGTTLNCTNSTGTGTAALSAVTVSPNVVTGGTIVSAVVLLDNPAPPSGSVVTMSSSNGSVASTPSSVTIGAGLLSATLPVTTGGVSSPTGVTLTATYNGIGRTAGITVNPVLALTGVQAQLITALTATIVWTSNVPATSQVNYGPTTSYGHSSVLNTTPVVSHSVALSGLLSSTLYHFQVVSTDVSGHRVVSGDFTLTTPAGGYSVTMSPANAAGFDSVTVMWTAPSGRPATDSVYIVAVGAPNSAAVRAFTTGGTTSGTKIVIAPATAGQYEARYIVGSTELTYSAAVSITSPVGYSVTAPATATVGDTLQVRWTAPAGRPTNDYLALYSTQGTRYWFQYTGGATSGTFTLPAPAIAGQYVFRYCLLGSVTTAVSSASFPVQ
jgi:hypothetical protein